MSWKQFSHCGLALSIFVVMVATACRDPRDTPIPTDPAQWDASVQPAVNQLPDNDRRLAVAYLARLRSDAAASRRPIASGLTLRAGIEEERTFQQAQLTARIGSQQAQDRQTQQRKEFDQQVAQFLEVRLLRKEVAPTNLTEGGRTDRATVQIEIRNVGTQDVTEINGTVALMDGFMREDLKTYELNYREPLPAGDIVRLEKTLELDRFLISDLRFRNTDTHLIGVQFHARVVRFADGRQMEPPSQTG